MNSYVSSLEQSGRSSWKEVRNALNRHVLEKFPQLVNQAAHTITTKQLVGVLRPIHMSGKGRQGNKIRSYLRAAFERALSAENNPAEDQELTGYKITSNPVSAIAANTHLNRSAKNPLNKAELIKYWQLIKNEPGVRGLALRLHLLSGSPRPAQLIRLKPADMLGTAASDSEATSE